MTSLVLGVALTVVTVLGLLLNGYILVVIVLTKQIQTANNLLLLHLGIVDTLLCTIFLLFSAPGMFRGLPGWLGFTAPCTIHGFLFTLLHPMALWTLTGLNCDRYLAISAPLHYGAVVSPRKVAMGLSAAWIVALILCIPPLFFVAPYRYSSELAGCAPDFGHGDGAIWYSSVYTLLTLLLPAALILGCNIKVLMIARYHRHRIASAIFEVTLSAQVTITHQRNPFTPPVLSNPGGPRFLRSRSAISSVLQLLGSFLILYFPYYSAILWESSSTIFLAGNKIIATPIPPLFLTVASTLLTCSPPVNGLLYGVKSKVLRKTFQNYWRKQMSKSEMNQEIQARTPSACGSRRPSLTPLGLMTRPVGQRRLSEALLDPHRTGNGKSKPRIQRIASELNWRPRSSSGLSLIGFSILPRSRSFKDRITHHTASCNTLRVPINDSELSTIEDDDAKTFANPRQGSLEGSSSLGGHLPQSPRLGNISSANLFLQRVFGVGNDIYQKEISVHAVKRAAAIQTVLASTPRRSPRILITRAFSEESESPPMPATPSTGHMGRLYSNSTNSLLDRKWMKYHYHEANSSVDESSGSDTFRHGHLNVVTSVGSSMGGDGNNNSSCSSTDDDGSEASSGRLYLSLDHSGHNSVPLVCDNEVNSDKVDIDEDIKGETDKEMSHQDIPPAYILSWPTTRKKNSNMVNSSSMNGKGSITSRVLLARSFTDITSPSEFVL